jgi:hypothetical protein
MTINRFFFPLQYFAYYIIVLIEITRTTYTMISLTPARKKKTRYLFKKKRVDTNVFNTNVMSALRPAFVHKFAL